MSAQDLTNESTAVFYGKCTKKRCEWNEKKSKIYTYVTISPEEYIKGNLGSEVVIAVPGGQVGNIIYEVSETPVFTEGEDVVAFVWKNPSGRNLITGGHQGRMKIEKDSKTGKRFVTDMDDVTETTIQGQENVNKSRKVKLEEYVTKLKGYMKH